MSHYNSTSRIFEMGNEIFLKRIFDNLNIDQEFQTANIQLQGYQICFTSKYLKYEI